MKITTSNKKRTSFAKPLIKKGYYAAQLIGIRPMTRDGEDIEVTTKNGFTKKLIFDFKIYSTNDKDEPVKVVKFEDDGQEYDVKLSKFLPYLKKNTGETEFSSNFTPQSHITNLLELLGWTYKLDEELELDDYIGKWIVVNVNTWDSPNDGKQSQIAEFSEYEGPKPTIGAEFEEGKSSSKSLEEQLKDGDITQVEFANAKLAKK